MKELIERIKKQNGNERLNEKDMLWYLVERIDNLHEKFDEQCKNCNEKFDKKLDKNVFIKAISLIIAGITAMISILKFWR